MYVRKCLADDAAALAAMNMRLIEDEGSDNPMNLVQLEQRMRDFLMGEYSAFFFENEGQTVGYALVKMVGEPLYLRQFYIERNFRRVGLGKEAFFALMEYLAVDSIDLEVLSHNESGMRFWQKCGFAERSRYMRLEKR